MRRFRALRWITNIIILVLIFMVGAMFIDEPLLRYLLNKTNSKLTGYRIEVKDMDFNPFNLGLLLDDINIIQARHPDPPVLKLETLYLHLHFRDLLSGRMVAVCELQSPDININLPQLKEDKRIREKTPERHWQQALLETYPMEINRLEIHNGKAVYIAAKGDKPIRIDDIQARIDNIRNIRYPEETYPSSFQFQAVLFQTGRLKTSGRANFLRTPHAGVKGSYKIDNMELGRLKPVLQRFGIFLASGVFNADGEVEFSPDSRELLVRNLTVSQLKVDYIMDKSDQSPEKEEKNGKETMPLHYFVDTLEIEGEAGLVNKTVSPDYRLYITNFNLRITNLSDRFRKGGADVDLNGLFMGNGDTIMTGTFRETDTRPDFTLMTKIVGTNLTSLNPLFRAYAGLDVAAGSMTIYSDIKVANGRIDGFVKPFFTDVDIYSEHQEKRQDLLQQMYEGFVDVLADILENEPREMATKVNLSGPLDKPDASTLEVLLYLIENAFFEALLPNFEEYTQSGSQKRKDTK